MGLSVEQEAADKVQEAVYTALLAFSISSRHIGEESPKHEAARPELLQDADGYWYYSLDLSAGSVFDTSELRVYIKSHTEGRSY